MTVSKGILAIALLGACTATALGQTQPDRLLGNQALQEALSARHAVYVGTIEAYLEEFFLQQPTFSGSVYEVAPQEALPLVRQILDGDLGVYAFLLEMNFGINNELEKIAVVPLANQIELLSLMGIQGNDFEISNNQIVEWFKKWSTEFDFRITGVGIDFIMADILTPPKDWDALAAEIYSMCPDVVDQGTGTVGDLAAEMRGSMVMFFWWD